MKCFSESGLNLSLSIMIHLVLDPNAKFIPPWLFIVTLPHIPNPSRNLQMDSHNPLLYPEIANSTYPRLQLRIWCILVGYTADILWIIESTSMWISIRVLPSTPQQRCSEFMNTPLKSPRNRPVLRPFILNYSPKCVSKHRAVQSWTARSPHVLGMVE